MNLSPPAQARRPWYRPSLTTQIMIGLVVGGLIGWLQPDWGNKVYFLRDIFINLIKSIIAPLVFSTIVVGIAGAGALKKVGRMGIKALVYFEIVTTAALFIGLAVVNFTKPGIGVALAATNIDAITMLFWSAVINGVAAVPIMFAMMWIVTRGSTARPLSFPRWIKALGWIGTVLMAITVGLLIWASATSAGS